jgi:hypothetical protein
LHFTCSPSLSFASAIFFTVHSYEDVSKSFRTEWLTKYTPTTTNTRWEATQRVMAAKLARLTHKIAIYSCIWSQRAVLFAVLAPGGQSGSFWIHPRIRSRGR